MKITRTISLIIGTFGASVTVMTTTTMWWLIVVMAVVIVGALYEIWRRDSRVSNAPTSSTFVVLAAVVVLFGVSLGAGYAIIPIGFVWVGVAAFVLAWLDYIVALAKRRDALAQRHATREES